MWITRRAFLVGAGGVVAAGVAAESQLVSARRRTVLRWVKGFSGTASARDLGIEYLTRYPSEASQAVLLSRLGALVRLSSLFVGAGRAPAGFNEQLRRDFVAGDVVRMGGWLLSRTELRLYALVALEQEQETGVKGVFAPLPLSNREVLYWTAPLARFVMPADTSTIEFQLRSGADAPQRVAVRVGGKTVDERQVWGSSWQHARYVMQPAGRSMLEVELVTTPAWRPANDFRTIGIGIDRRLT